MHVNRETSLLQSRYRFRVFTLILAAALFLSAGFGTVKLQAASTQTPEEIRDFIRGASASFVGSIGQPSKKTADAAETLPDTPATETSPPSVAPAANETLPVAAPTAEETLPVAAPTAEETLPVAAPTAEETLPVAAPAVEETLPAAAPAVETLPAAAPAVEETLPAAAPAVEETLPAAAPAAETLPAAAPAAEETLPAAAQRTTFSLDDYQKAEPAIWDHQNGLLLNVSYMAEQIRLLQPVAVGLPQQPAEAALHFTNGSDFVVMYASFHFTDQEEDDLSLYFFETPVVPGARSPHVGTGADLNLFRQGKLVSAYIELLDRDLGVIALHYRYANGEIENSYWLDSVVRRPTEAERSALTAMKPSLSGPNEDGTAFQFSYTNHLGFEASSYRCVLLDEAGDRLTCQHDDTVAPGAVSSVGEAVYEDYISRSVGSVEEAAAFNMLLLDVRPSDFSEPAWSFFESVDLLRIG